MVEKNDWRLTGQEKYLSEKKLYLRVWKSKYAHSDHNHCIFCCNMFSEFPETLHEGYTTDDNRYWICPKCYDDFKDMFKWSVIDDV